MVSCIVVCLIFSSRKVLCFLLFSGLSHNFCCSVSLNAGYSYLYYSVWILPVIPAFLSSYPTVSPCLMLFVQLFPSFSLWQFPATVTDCTAHASVSSFSFDLWYTRLLGDNTQVSLNWKNHCINNKKRTKKCSFY